jgi:hypothetical protein
MKVYHCALFAIPICCTGCYSPPVDTKQLLGSKSLSTHTAYYRDFIGISPHGELFDFQECDIDTVGLSKLTLTTAFRQAPNFTPFQTFYKSRLQNVNSATWRNTPINASDNAYFQTILQFGNLQNDDSSRRFLRNNYLSTPGNFYAYFVAFPPGYNLYVLVPTEGKLFIIRKRG